MHSMDDPATNKGQCQGGVPNQCPGERNPWGGWKARGSGHGQSGTNWIH